jgi:general secretion pathway protein H
VTKKSATGTSPSRVEGFTLLEILVVVLIIGIVTAGMLLTMNFTGKDTQLQTESQRLLSLMDYARDQAELQTRNYGIVFSQHGYAFVVYGVRTGAWRQVFEDDVLRERTLPRGLDFKLVVDARPIVLSDSITLPQAPKGSNSTPHAGSGSAPDSAADSSSDSNADSGSDSDSSSDSTAFAPQVMIFSSGDLSSFKITLERPTAGRSITLDENQDGNIVSKPMVESGS